MVTTLSWQSVQSCWGIMFVCFVVAHYHYWLYNSVNEGCAKEWVFAGALNYSVDGFILMFAVLICLSCELGVSVCVFSLYFHQKCFFLLLCFHRPRLYFIYIFLIYFLKYLTYNHEKLTYHFISSVITQSAALLVLVIRTAPSKCNMFLQLCSAVDKTERCCPKKNNNKKNPISWPKC